MWEVFGVDSSEGDVDILFGHGEADAGPVMFVVEPFGPVDDGHDATEHELGVSVRPDHRANLCALHGGELRGLLLNGALGADGLAVGELGRRGCRRNLLLRPGWFSFSSEVVDVASLGHHL